MSNATPPSVEAPKRSQTALFSKRVGDFMRASPSALGADAPCRDAARAMTERDVSSVTVVDAAGRPVGILTERDLVRRVMFRDAGDTAVGDVMTEPVHVVRADEYLYHAIAVMRRRGLRHMPVVDGARRLVGMLNLHDALAVAAGRLMGQIDRLTQEVTLDGLREVKAAQVDLAAELLDDSLPAPEVQQVLTRVNNDIYRRVIDAHVTAMTAAPEWGPPPVAFSAIVFGSGGRGENYLFPDQDNGFILADYPDDAHTRVDAWFIELAERMTRDLDAVGLPYCKGYCMASNPLWRKSISQWKEQIALWGRKRNFIAVRLSDIFYDFRPVWGDDALAEALRAYVTDLVQHNHFFHQAIFEEVKDHGVALTFFGHLMVEKDDEHKGLANLKHAGLLPLVETVRLLSLRHGIAETATLARIGALAAEGFLNADETDRLKAAFATLTDVLLRRQIEAFKTGAEVGYHVDPKALPSRLTEALEDGLKTVKHLRERMRADMTGDIF
jgi:signal-transduction protein with cAMP-binding, CBS, and nucleotidyltransferase domain